MPIRDFDSGERAQRIRLLAWAFLGAVFGGTFAWMLAPITGTTGPTAPIVGAIIGAVVICFGATILADAAVRGAVSVFAPSGSSTPQPRAYSGADALAAQGRNEDAIEILRRIAGAAPDDPEPCVRIARIHRDGTGRYEEAVAWFRNALNRARQPVQEQAIARELVEMLIYRLDEPRLALPVLARIAERYANEPAGRWARDQLTTIKTQTNP